MGAKVDKFSSGGEGGIPFRLRLQGLPRRPAQRVPRLGRRFIRIPQEHQKRTERVGFEPTNRLSAVTRFPIVAIQPLSHLSLISVSEDAAKGAQQFIRLPLRRKAPEIRLRIKMAERGRFELPRPLRAYRFSRAAPSTTRATSPNKLNAG